MKKHILKNNLSRGEASVIFSFIVLVTVLMGSIVISFISINTIKGAKSGENSALALYAADTGIERGTFEYWWANYPCRGYTNEPTIGSTTYSLLVDDGAYGTSACPDAFEVSNATKRLCINAIGKSGGTERKLTSESGGGSVACVWQ